MRKRRGKCAPASVEMERGSWSCAQTTESPVEKGLVAKPGDSFRAGSWSPPFPLRSSDTNSFFLHLWGGFEEVSGADLWVKDRGGRTPPD